MFNAGCRSLPAHGELSRAALHDDVAELHSAACKQAAQKGTLFWLGSWNPKQHMAV